MQLSFLIINSTAPFHPAVKWERLIPCSISSSVLCVSLEIITEISIKSFQPKCSVFIITDAKFYNNRFLLLCEKIVAIAKTARQKAKPNQSKNLARDNQAEVPFLHCFCICSLDPAKAILFYYFDWTFHFSEGPHKNIRIPDPCFGIPPAQYMVFL